MCRDCGCQEANFAKSHHSHELRLRPHSISIPNSFVPVATPRKLLLEQSILAKNDAIAEENKEWFAQKNMRVLNIMSSPGSGKTMLLEKTVEALQNNILILTGDQEQDFDAKRLEAKGAIVKQLNTHSSCHLDAAMIRGALDFLDGKKPKLLVIENVGNLVCPAAFDLGESEKIALLSTTEGEDKPAKYPLLFHEADLIIVSKIDLCPYLDWNWEKCLSYIRKVNSKAPILLLSAKTGQGMKEWIDYISSPVLPALPIQSILGSPLPRVL